MRSSCILTFFLLSLVASSLSGQSFPTTLMMDLIGSTYRVSPTEVAAPPGAAIHWKVKDQDTGFLQAGSSFETRYKFKNSGSQELIIKSVNCSCNGAKASFQDQVIPPGEDSEINLELTPTQSGSFSCHLSVLSNTAEMVDVLTLRGIALQ
ncbi:MAG: DUF1573 domain-containing protein [Bacteroidota bacterium]